MHHTRLNSIHIFRGDVGITTTLSRSSSPLKAKLAVLSHSLAAFLARYEREK